MASSVVKAETVLMIEQKYINFGVINSQTDYELGVDIAKSGWKPIGIVGYRVNGTYKTHFCVTAIYIYNTTAIASLRAPTGSFTTDGTTVDVWVLYANITA